MILVAYIEGEGNHFDAGMRLTEFLLDGKQRRFASLNKDKLAGFLLGNLAAQFAADAASRTRHHHHRPANQPRDTLFVQRNRIPAQQILRINPPQMAHRNVPVEQLRHGRKNVVVQTESIHAGHQLLDRGGLGPRHGDDDFLQAEIARDRGEVPARAHDRLSMHRAADLGVVVVDQTHHL